MPKEDNTCFVISPIGSDKGDTRNRSDKLLNHIIKPVAVDLGLIAQRADEIALPGNITSQIVRKLVESKMVIADLTDRNPNVFYELAIRHALSKPVVLMYSDHEELPFDIRIYRAIRYDITDYDMREPVIRELKKQIKNQLGGSRVISNPFSDALPTISLERGSTTEDEKLMSIVRMIESLSDKISLMNHNSRTEEIWKEIERNSRPEIYTDEKISDLVDFVSRYNNMHSKLRKLQTKEHKTKADTNLIYTYTVQLADLKREIDKLGNS